MMKHVQGMTEADKKKTEVVLTEIVSPEAYSATNATR